MLTTTLFLAAALTDLPLTRFPALDACDARIRVLLEQRHRLNLAEPSPARDAVLRANTHALACWEALLAARGGLEEEGEGMDSPAVREAAARRLRELLGDVDWRAGRMP